MTPLDQAVIQKVNQWLRFADEDLQLARHGLTISRGAPYRLIAYHAQQCAEKHLKAYLVFRRVDFPYTHNISHLLDLCARFVTWTDLLRDAEELSPYAITTRYPGEDEAVTLEEVRRAISLAEIVREQVREALRQEGMEIE